MSSRDPYNPRGQYPGSAQYPHPQQPHAQQGQPQQPYAQQPYPQPGQPPQGHPQYPLQAERVVQPHYDDDLTGIPMKKSNPKVLLAIAGAAVLVLGVAAYSMFGGKKVATVSPAAATAAQASQAEEAAKAKALREHVELTQRSLAKLEGEGQPKKAAQPAAPAEPEPAPAEPEPTPRAAAAAPAKRTTTSSAKAPAPRAKTASAPAPKPAKRAPPPKSLESLDDLGKGITSELGK